MSSGIACERALRGETQGALHPWQTPPILLRCDEDLDMYPARNAVEWIQNYSVDKPFYLQVLFPGSPQSFRLPRRGTGAV